MDNQESDDPRGDDPAAHARGGESNDVSSEVPFGPPTPPIEVECLHCGAIYDSSLIVLRHDEHLGELAWSCPMDGCDGVGFGFDLLPTDPEYRDENGGWVTDDDDEYDDEMDAALPPIDAADDAPHASAEAERAARLRRLFGEPDAKLTDDDMPF